MKQSPRRLPERACSLPAPCCGEPGARAGRTLPLLLPSRLGIVTLAEVDAERRAGQAEGVAQAVLQVAQVGGRQIFRLGAEDGEGRRSGLGLRDVLEADRPAARGRRRVRGGRRVEPAVEVGGRHATLPHLIRSEEHTSELQSLMRISYAVFCLKKKQKCTRRPT